MDALSETAVCEAFDEFVCACDRLLTSALTDLYQNPLAQGLIQRIRESTVRQIRRDGTRHAVAKAINTVNGNQTLGVLEQMLEFARSSDATAQDSLLPKLDAARGILHRSRVLAGATTADIHSLLSKFDVLLAGGIGESSGMWTAPA
jgi:hypothetical protein